MQFEYTRRERINIERARETGEAQLEGYQGSELLGFFQLRVVQSQLPIAHNKGPNNDKPKE